MSDKTFHSSPALYCLIDILRAAVQEAPDQFALLAPDRVGLTYKQLFEHVTAIVPKLNSIGLTTSSRVALSLPNGPELATTLISVMSGMAVIPLNPDYVAEEVRNHLIYARINAVIVQKGLATPARSVAAQLGIPVLEIVPDLAGPVGLFDLEGIDEPDNEATFSNPDDVAHILFTSGTTSTPKFVAKTQRDLFDIVHTFTPFVRAWGIVDVDVLVNMLPLFHSFGLNAITAGLTRKKSLVCATHFSVHDFYAYLDRYKLKVFWALPAMLQAIVAEAPDYEDILSRSALHVFFSSSAPLSPSVIDGVSQSFNAIICQFYGLTETGTIAWASPNMPTTYRAGSVGKIVPNIEAMIADEDGAALPNGTVGEIVVRGPTVIKGYDANPEADAQAFIDGWFHTGDTGYVDNDGFLFITGRIKEVINRGGEKVSPYEIDNVLLQHPAVVQAAAFAVPHDALGEDVAAAVVLKQHSAVTERELRQFAAQHLAPQKVPTRIIAVDSLPMTASGKIRRIGLAQQLGLVTLTN